jgi:hypothetical protein
MSPRVRIAVDFFDFQQRLLRAAGSSWIGISLCRAVHRCRALTQLPISMLEHMANLTGMLK